MIYKMALVLFSAQCGQRRRGGTDRIGAAILLCHFQRACAQQIVYSGGKGAIAKY
jgi:hypothetical protein